MGSDEQRWNQMEMMVQQLIQMVANNNSTVAEIKADMTEMKANMGAMEARLAEGIEEVRNVLRTYSNHFAQKIGLLERDMAELRSQS